MGSVWNRLPGHQKTYKKHVFLSIEKQCKRIIENTHKTEREREREIEREREREIEGER